MRERISDYLIFFIYILYIYTVYEYIYLYIYITLCKILIHLALKYNAKYSDKINKYFVCVSSENEGWRVEKQLHFIVCKKDEVSKKDWETGEVNVCVVTIHISSTRGHYPMF